MYSTHPDCRSPEPNATIWRYCDLAKFVSLLDRKALYFSSVAVLNDKYEGSLTLPSFELVLTALSWPREDFIQFLQELRRKVCVNCWHLNEVESEAMWQIYAGYNAGVAIRSTFERLCKSFDQTQQTIFISEVGYVNDYTTDMLDILSPVENADSMPMGQTKITSFEDGAMSGHSLKGFVPFLQKRKSFEYERKLRALHFGVWHRYEPGEVVTPPQRGFHVQKLERRTHPESGIAVPVDISILIEKVYVSPTAPQYFLDSVLAICKEFGLANGVVRSSSLTAAPLY